MKGAIILLGLLLAPPPTEWVVRETEPLAKVAERALGDARAASELKALNGLKSDTVPAGTTLKLPGQDRTRALKALASARTAVAKANRTVERREEADAKLKEAEASFQAARYEDAALAANSAWELVSTGASQPQAFSVEVSDAGTTTVEVRSGQPVRVEAEGVTQQVHTGQSVRVEPGQPPTSPPPPTPLATPKPTSPGNNKRLTLPSTKGLLGPVTLAWSAVSGAEKYVVEVVPPSGDRLSMDVDTAQVQLKPLPPGQYQWTVRAVGQGAKSEASAAHRFELVDGKLKLNVNGTTQWK